MLKKHFLIVTISVIAVVTVFILHAYGITGTGYRLEFQTLEKGWVSEHMGSAYYVINTADEWADVFERSPPPEIDFSETTVIAVFMGRRPTGGYGIEVKEIIDTGFLVVIKVEQTSPGKGCILLQVITSPYHIVKVDKIGKGVRFDTVMRITDCG